MSFTKENRNYSSVSLFNRFTISSQMTSAGARAATPCEADVVHSLHFHCGRVWRPPPDGSGRGKTRKLDKEGKKEEATGMEE